MQLTQKIKIKPSGEQKQVLWDLSEKCRLIYNFAMMERKEHFSQYKKSISYIDQQNQLPLIKSRYPEYKWVYSKVLQYTLRRLDADFKSFFVLWKKGDKSARPPKYKGKKFLTTMTFNQSGFKYQKGWIQLSHKHPLDTSLNFEISKKFSFGKIYQISVYLKDGDFFLSIVYEKKEKEYKNNDKYQAFDLGVIKHTAINSKGRTTSFKIQRPDKYWYKKTSKLQSRRDHCKPNSRRYKYFDKILKRCKRKSANQIRDFQHKLSHKIVNNTRANTIIVEDLSVKDMCKINKYQKGLHISLHNTGNIGRFVGFLTYKAQLCGKRVIEIDERGTSKQCCICGYNKDMPLYVRSYNCEICGNETDRDENSATNIMLRFLSQNGLWTAYQQFVDNLRQTGMGYAQQKIPIHSQEIPCMLLE